MSSDRREFFRKMGQLSSLTAIFAGTGYLVYEKRITLNGCSTSRLCSQCRKMETCSLDPAREQRKNSSPGIKSNNQ